MKSSRSVLAVAAICAAASAAFALPAGFSQRVLISNLDAVSTAMLPDGRVLAIEKFGKVHLIKDSVVLSQPFLDWESNTQSAYEKGMMGILADPDFAVNGYIYVQYCNKRIGANGRDQVSRFTVAGDTVDRNSEQLMISLGDAGANYHHGSGLVIIDGKLFVASGCRGQVNDGAPGPANAADKNLVEGKILRINIPGGDIPADNPFYNVNTGDGRAVYYYGLRNPFTMSRNPANGRLWFSEVRSAAADDQLQEGGAPGTDYGFTGRTGPTPLWTSASASIGGRAMIGSLWYTGNNFPAEWRGYYFFGGIDVTQLKAMAADRQGGAKNFSAFQCPIDVKQDAAGAIYVTTRCQTENVRYTTGKVTKIWYGAEPVSILRPGQMSGLDAHRKMSWSVVPGGLWVKATGPGRQSVELRGLDGQRVAHRDFSAPGEAGLLIAGASGAHFLVWKSGARRAVAQVVLP